MKIVVVLNRSWSLKLFYQFQRWRRSLAIEIPVYVVSLSPIDQRLLSIDGVDQNIDKFLEFPIHLEDLDRDDDTTAIDVRI